MSRRIAILGVRPVHPGRKEPSRIEMAVVLHYLKGEPVENIVLTRKQATVLIERLAWSILATDP